MQEIQLNQSSSASYQARARLSFPLLSKILENNDVFISEADSVLVNLPSDQHIREYQD